MDTQKLKRFHALVRHAYEHSPYYHRLIDERGIKLDNCQPEDFPVLTKSLLMANFDDIVTDKQLSKQAITDFLSHSTDPNERLFNRFIVMHTSGTSGEVGYFIYSKADYRRMVRGSFRGRRPQGSTGKKRPFQWRRGRLAFYGAIGGHFGGVTSVKQMLRGPVGLFVRGEFLEVNSPLPEVLESLNRFQPDVIIGYTMGLKILAEQQRAGVLRIDPVSISATGESCSKADMEFLSESFDGASIVSLYGCTEHLMMGHSNPDGETMTLFDRNLHFEFFADHTIVTNLFNYTMPLIRYRMADIIEPLTNTPGQPLVIRNLVGRSEQMPRFVNRRGETDFISPHTINEIFVSGVARFQFRVADESSFTFVICLEPGLDEPARARAVAGTEHRLQEILQQKGLDNVKFAVKVVDDIPLNPRTGKFQLIAVN